MTQLSLANPARHQQQLMALFAAVRAVRAHAIAARHAAPPAMADYVESWFGELEPAITATVTQAVIDYGGKIEIALNQIVLLLKESHQRPDNEQCSQIAQRLHWLTRKFEGRRAEIAALPARYAACLQPEAGEWTPAHADLANSLREIERWWAGVQEATQAMATAIAGATAQTPAQFWDALRFEVHAAQRTWRELIELAASLQQPID